jgi:hypothetical protein
MNMGKPEIDQLQRDMECLPIFNPETLPIFTQKNQLKITRPVRKQDQINKTKRKKSQKKILR